MSAKYFSSVVVVCVSYDVVEDCPSSEMRGVVMICDTREFSFAILYDNNIMTSDIWYSNIIAFTLRL